MMDDFVQKLDLHNSMVLIPENGVETESSIKIINNFISSKSILDLNLPCKKIKASTPWKRQRDQILFDYIGCKKLSPESLKHKPILIFVNSRTEVNLMASSFRSEYFNEEVVIKAIGTPLTLKDFFSELKSSLGTFSFLILSAESALAAFVHGIVRTEMFSEFIFADARGANQNHPFCTLMNYFYTPLRLNEVKPRILGFTDLKSISEVEENMFSRREWAKNLKHIAHTFHCVPLTIDPLDHERLIHSYIDQIPVDSALFNPLSIYDSTPELMKIPFNALEFFNLEIDINEISCECESIVLRHETSVEEIPSLLELLHRIKSLLLNLKRFIHIRSFDPHFSAQLSLFSCMKNLQLASIASAKSLDPLLASNLCRDATSLFSQSEHINEYTSGVERIVRIEETGALLVESTAIPILIRCCTLLAREFRQSTANETIYLKSIKAFPIDETGKKTSSFFSHLALLRLPQFFYERIMNLEGFSSLAATIETDRFHLQGPLVNSIYQAQSCVAFEACMLLLSAGILDRNLLLAEEFRKIQEDDNDNDAGQDDLEAASLNEFDGSNPQQLLDVDDKSADLSFNELIPKALLKPEEPVFKLHVYALEYRLKMQSSPEDPFGNDFEALQLTPRSRLLLEAIPSIDFFSVSRSIRTWSIILPAPIPESFVPVEIPLGSDHYLKTELRLIGSLDSDSMEYNRLLATQQSFFGMFNMKPITVPDYKNDSLEDTDDCIVITSVPKDKQPFYLIAPLIEDSHAHLDDPEMVEIASIPKVKEIYKKFVERFRAAPLSGIQYKPAAETEEPTLKNWTIDWKLCEKLCDETKYRPSSLLDYLRALEDEEVTEEVNTPILLEEGGVLIDFKRFALERLAFLTPHTKIFYRVNRPLRVPIYPTDPFESPAYVEANTHAAYVEARYGLQVRELERAMLEVKRIENWSDLAVWISEDGATKKRRKNTKIRPPGTTAHVSVIIPELTVIFAASYSTFRLSMFLPRVSFEIERQLRISQFFTDRLTESLALPRHSRQVEALTASTAALSYSYEQLEVLGDSFLKYYSSLDTLLVGAGWSEGRLSSHRQQSLSNAVLRKAAEKLHLTTYASFTPFFSKLWCPPPVLEARNRSALDRNVNRVLFGASERWRLLSLVEGKQVDKHQIYLLDLHTRLLTVDQDYRTKEQAKNSTDALFKYGQLIPPKALADMIEALIAIYYIDAGPRAALQFLNFCGILKADETRIMGMERFADPLALILGSNAWDTLKLEQQEKLKRRKLTPITEIILNNSSTVTEEPSSPPQEDQQKLSEVVKRIMSIDIPPAPKVDNVQPFAPSFPVFPFEACESILGHRFRHRELLFMACTHISLHSHLNHEKLEWIGDAAIDWIVCRHYWYKYRILSSSQIDGEDHEDKGYHVPRGYLPLTPEALTNSRQSAINNESFARLIVRHKLHHFLRINSPHLQIEIDKFAIQHCKAPKDADDYEEIVNTNNYTNTNNDPDGLKNLHTHVSMAAPKVLGDLFESLMGAILLDCAFDIEAFARTFEPFLTEICADPQSLPINAIQETLHMYARLGIPRHQIVCTYRDINTSTTADNALGVICQVWVRERCVAEAEGSNKLVAKKLAMERALQDVLSRSDHL